MADSVSDGGADVFLVFPPQWSPFQPPLSIPSLASWLRAEGFSVAARDLNIEFYDWLLSDECAALLRESARAMELNRQERSAYDAIFSSVKDFRDRILRPPPSPAEAKSMDTLSDAEYVARHFSSIRAFRVYLEAISHVTGLFTISPFSFEFETPQESFDALIEGRLDTQLDPIVEEFADRSVERIVSDDPKAIGLSCIGQEQLFFTLLLGKRLKERTSSPVVVGGTILSRMFERGVLREEWFGKYFDIVVKNEGEIPATKILQNLSLDRDPVEDVPGVVYSIGGEITDTLSPAPLRPPLPIPDFTDLPLDQYFSAETTLPLLSSRGCYYGKCEFCHHGMVYGDGYAAYDTADVLDAVRQLSEKYGARRFAFNDEAIPPKLARRMGEQFPTNAETGWTFTALMKFERYYRSADWIALHKVGFRSIYVGLESASERVLALMKKHSSEEAMLSNLAEATAADIWMHTFLFFGFPGETFEEAQETMDFVLEHSDIIGSFGAGTFSLEHNAPISRRPEEFGLQLRASSGQSLSVYYDYEVSNGLSRAEASEFVSRLTKAAQSVPKYISAAWVPREHLLILLSKMSPDELVRHGRSVVNNTFYFDEELTEVFSITPSVDVDGSVLVLNRMDMNVFEVGGLAATAIRLMESHGETVRTVTEFLPRLTHRGFSSRSAI